MKNIVQDLTDLITGKEFEIRGLWERYGDTFEGCIILVNINNGELIGSITQLPWKMVNLGWKVGDIKWKGLKRVKRNRYSLKDMFKEVDSATNVIKNVTYQDTSIHLKANARLTLHSDTSISIFHTQKWRKIGNI